MAGRAGGGAVRQKGQLRTDHAEDQSPDSQPGQVQCTQPADDRGVEQQVERLGGQHTQRGQSQLRDLAATRLRLARLAHPRAARSEETTSSAEPVVE